METLVSSPSDIELNLLTEWGDPNTSSRTRKAAVYSVLVHVVVIAILVIFPPSVSQRPLETAQVHRTITPLIDPPTELTQKAPNHGKISKEFNAAEIEERPRVQLPPEIPSTSRKRPQNAAPIPAMTAPKPTPAVPLPEPPKLDTAAKEQPKSVLPQVAMAPPPPPPQIQTEEKPKIVLEAPSAAPAPPPPGQSKVPMPSSSVADAMRQVIRGNVSGAGMTVGDSDSPGQAGYGSGVNLPAKPGAPASQLQLLSDPMGVDFRPYLIRVLTSVKQHWLAVIPESVRMGRRGKVVLQFSIARDGQVPKLVIADASGADALDRAAVAGVSASVPFPPLPTEFKGDKIVLQFNFAYNSK
ncbi:MAG TPA: TonB family protein [Bryobacteraceae bacterium]|nr:TonB family protein [Bryobacteraceae bacterium]